MTTTTTTTFPTISRRNEDGTWSGFEAAFCDWDFSPEDGDDRESLTAWLAEIVADNGEGEWSAEYNGVESDVVTTGPTTDDVLHIARDTLGPDAGIKLIADDCGYLTLVQITLADGTIMVIGPEAAGGYTWSTYTTAAAAEALEPLDTDGDDTIATLPDAIREQAAK